MALSMTLQKENNHLYHEFVNAYWIVEDVAYNFDHVGFALKCYPSREASKKVNSDIPTPSLPIGGCVLGIYSPCIYSWQAEFKISDVFPNGIPLGRDAQLTEIYRWVKDYTELPFEDVFE